MSQIQAAELTQYPSTFTTQPQMSCVKDWHGSISVPLDKNYPDTTKTTQFLGEPESIALPGLPVSSEKAQAFKFRSAND